MMTSIVTSLPWLPANPPPRPLHDPRIELRIGGAIIGLFLFGFVGWSAVARLDAAVHAPGVVQVAGKRQSVQSLSGGIMTAINVHDGSVVRAGDVLVNFATTDTLAQEQSLLSRVIGLQAEISRIRAEQSGVQRIAEPIEWSALTAPEHTLATAALASEQGNLEANRAVMSSQQAVLNERLAQAGAQVDGYGQRQKANGRQRALVDDELTGIRELYSKGYATKTRVLSLERTGVSIDADIGQTQAEIARLRTSAGETRMQMLQARSVRSQQNTDRLRAAETELLTLLPQWRAARDAVARSAVAAPVSGTVTRLTATTIGGVASAGQKLMEIVPSQGSLEIEAHVALDDANDLHAGQPADVRITGLRARNVPVIHGHVRRVSADSLVDEATGRSYFTATIELPVKELAEASRAAGVDGVKSGTPADVVIPLRRRTALEYWIGPLEDRLRPALTEG